VPSGEGKDFFIRAKKGVVLDMGVAIGLASELARSIRARDGVY